MHHSADRVRLGPMMDRRGFLRRSAGAAAVLSGGWLLSACGGDGSAGGAGGTRAIGIARPDDPVTIPIYEDNPPIDSGLDPEGGPLKIYNWDEYIRPKVVKDFAKEYGVDYELSTFYNMSEAIAKVRTGQVDYDVFFPTVDFVPKLAAARLLRPLNHDYLPNLERNIWPRLADPFYDRGSRYTVPYVVYTTGIGWRTDLVDDDIAALDNPYEIFWDSKYEGKVGIYDDYREAIQMVLLKNGITDVNTDDPSHLELAKKDLIEMADAVNVRTTIAGAYQKLPEGEFAIHQAWSGDMVAAPYYMPQKDYGDPRGVLRYWWPEDGKGVVGNDTIVVLKGGRNPVLAHHFLNFLLDTGHGLTNFAWVGYQPPFRTVKPGTLVRQEYVVPNLDTAVVRENYFDTGYIGSLALRPEDDQLWQSAWTEFKSGA
jgi:spermidine/putrescine transport system substrate-binding protein